MAESVSTCMVQIHTELITQKGLNVSRIYLRHDKSAKVVHDLK